MPAKVGDHIIEDPDEVNAIVKHLEDNGIKAHAFPSQSATGGYIISTKHIQIVMTDSTKIIISKNPPPRGWIPICEIDLSDPTSLDRLVEIIREHE